MGMSTGWAEIKVGAVDLLGVVEGALFIGLCFCGDLRAVRGVRLPFDGEAYPGDLRGTLSINS